MMYPRQEGVALITALLLVFLATTTAVEAVYSFQLTLNRSSVVLGQRQAWYYALGGEAWAMESLRRDREDNDIDHLKEAWATPIPGLAIQGGALSGEIQDLQGRFNLNNLVDEEGKAIPDRVEQFSRLLNTLQLDADIGPAVVDWIDSDLDPRPGGAESADYLLRNPPHIAANLPMSNVSELRQIQGITRQVYELLAPHVSVLPSGTALNVNTATQPVLASLAEDLSSADAAALREGAGEKGYQSIDEFLAHESLAGLDPPLDGAGLDVASRYFTVSAEVNTDYGRVRLDSVVERAPGQPLRVVNRSVGGL
jgi:general secretion pathway protein K